MDLHKMENKETISPNKVSKKSFDLAASSSSKSSDKFRSQTPRKQTNAQNKELQDALSTVIEELDKDDDLGEIISDKIYDFIENDDETDAKLCLDDPSTSSKIADKDNV